MDKASKPEKAEKSTESISKTEKTATHRHHAARHHRHGSKAAKYGKAHTGTAMAGKHFGKPSKIAKNESRRVGHGKPLSKRAFGRASKHSPSEMTPR